MKNEFKRPSQDQIDQLRERLDFEENWRDSQFSGMGWGWWFMLWAGIAFWCAGGFMFVLLIRGN